MLPPIPIGIDDFQRIREDGLLYVDKTQLIRDVIDGGAQVVLLPRPRRFGKSLNLSMLRCWFEKRKEDFSSLFDGLAIWDAGETYRAHFQQHPVIHLTFKGAKHDSFEAMWASIQRKIQALFDNHRGLLETGHLSDREETGYRQVLDGTAPRTLHETALLDLSSYLHRAHGERVVLLIDEYDEPIHAAFVGGFARPMLEFTRAFFTEGLKGNPHLYKAVLTGILRVARESIFSGLNNLAVYSLLHEKMSTRFGFTEREVDALLEQAGRQDQLSAVRLWYNGYLFGGGTVIYNPWSVLSYLNDPAALTSPYWVSTSSNELIKHLLAGRAEKLTPTFEMLLSGSGIERILDENVVLDQLDRSDDALWSLLVFTGYLKAERRSLGPSEPPAHYLTIPNREVRLVYTSTFREWLEERMHGRGGNVDRLITALLSGDVETFEEQLQALAENMMSYHDGAVRPEQFYQGLLIGLLATLEPGHRVRSNRESGKGRPDVLVVPSRPNTPGVVLELKAAKSGKKTLEQALAEGVAQLQNKDYAAELAAAGAPPIHRFVVAFDGKQVRVRSADAE